MKKKKHETLLLLRAGKPSQLATALCTHKNELQQCIHFPSYETFEIKKKKGGTRLISAPEPALKKIQQNLNFILQDIYPEKSNIHGFIRKESRLERHDIYANACMHTGKKFVWNIDLQEFFPSISTERVKNMFMQPPFKLGEQVATYLSLLCCYRKQLPAGAPSSPMISNFICIPLDEAIGSWIKDVENNFGVQITYSRYADDCTFSYMTPLPQAAKEQLFTLINGHGFMLNQKKCREQSAAGAQWVTGIKVNVKPNIDRRYIRQLRAILYNVQKSGLTVNAAKYFNIPVEVTAPDHISTFLRSLESRIMFTGYIKGYDDPVFIKLKQALTALHHLPFGPLKDN